MPLGEGPLSSSSLKSTARAHGVFEPALVEAGRWGPRVLFGLSCLSSRGERIGGGWATGATSAGMVGRWCCALAVCAVRRESAAVVVFLRALWGGEKFIFARFSRGLA
jgi:hypothetical protein